MASEAAGALRASLLGAAATPRDEAALAAALARAQAAWPTATLSLAVFVPYLLERVPPASTIAAAIAATCVDDLWLACAVVAGQPSALRAFDEVCVDELPRALAYLDGGTALRGDVHLALRAQLLPASAGGAGALAGYQGRGRLRGWLRVVAVRAALQLLRRHRREVPLDEVVLAAHVDDGPAAADTSALAGHYRAAFAAALAELSPRERNLLRQQHLHAASLDELASLYGVHRATIARWIARSRTRVVRATRRHLGEALGVTGTELDQAMDALGRDLDASLRHTLSREV